MVDARESAEWERTSWIVAKIHNAHITRSFDAVTPEEVNPMRKRGQREQTSGALHRAIAATLPEDTSGK